MNSSRLWFTGKLSMRLNVVKSLIRFTWRCDITALDLCYQELTADEFSKIFQNLKNLNFDRSEVFTSTGERLTVGDILAMVPQLVEFEYDKNTRNDPITLRQSNNALPYLPNIKKIQLSRVPNSLDYNEVCEFLKEHPNVHFYIYFIKRHWSFAYHGAFMKAVKTAFPAGKTEYKHQFDSFYNDTSAYHGDRTWILTLENMKFHMFGEGD
uniref:Uncharacterized protein n=1 Tax=Panagrolaimus sp. ES5 TaxID=591445 RepID=A0AC34FW52_9BILA